MVTDFYRLEKNGRLTYYKVDPAKIQRFIDTIKEELSPKYYALVKRCDDAAVLSSVYKEYFQTNMVRIFPDCLESKYLGCVEEYEYIHDVFFDNNFAIHFQMKARIDRAWKFVYIIETATERMPPIIKEMVAEVLNKSFYETLKELNDGANKVI